MAYRAPPPQAPRPLSPDLADYEQKLLRSARRKKMIFAIVVGGLAIVGMGSCLGPIGYEITSDAWHHRKNKLTRDEAKEVSDVLGAIEADGKKSQEAFNAVWPQLRAGELGPRRDLGACREDVPGPSIQRKDAATSLHDSAQGVGWTFVDFTPESAHSPIGSLKMPAGSIALNNSGTGDRYVLPERALRTAPSDHAPTLDSTTTALRVAEWQNEAAAPIRHDDHASFIRRVKAFADDARAVDVVVFVDVWDNPMFTSERVPAPKDELEAFERGARPIVMFKGGLAIARAFVWSPAKRQVVCASQALAQSSPDLTFRSNDLAPLQQDLVLQLERSLQRSFVSVGDAPPRLERPLPAEPPPTATSDAGAPKKRPRSHR